MFVCTKCDAPFSKWSGQCTECSTWGTLVEASDSTAYARPRLNGTAIKPGKTESFSTIANQQQEYQKTGLTAWDRILSGGLVEGSVTLLGGEPGIGKSTLLAQLALKLSEIPQPPLSRGQGSDPPDKGDTGGLSGVLYVTGEESPSQVARRLKRLSPTIPSSLAFLDQTHAEVVAATIADTKPALTIVDSIQSMRVADVTGEAGNPNQVRASAAIIAEAAKRSHAPVILVGQVTKEGELAGPRLLEHLVDTVLMMEGDRNQVFRVLRVVKHRFGATDELAVFEMMEHGLQEVVDPSSALVAHRPKNTSGSIVSTLSQGSRVFLIEIQALVTPAGYGTPTRRVTGIDPGRLSLLLAVLGRRAGVNLSDQDVFVNVVGGVDAREPGIDLAICLALASAKYDIPLPIDLAAWGEVGLSGEIRPVPNQTGRIKESHRLGYKNVIEGCESLEQALKKLGVKR